MKTAPESEASEKKSGNTHGFQIYPLISLVAAGTLSGIPGDFFAFPFSRIKTVMMTQGADASSTQLTSMSAIRFIYNEQGVRGFFRGFSPVMFSAIPGTTLFFAGMDFTQKMLGQNALGTALSGFGGQIAGSIVWVPSEVFKELRQMILIKPELRDKKVSQLIKYVYQTEGLRGFYRGFLAQLLTFGPFNSIGLSLSKLLHDKVPDEKRSTLTSFCLNGVAFGAAGVITTPFDVVKTRLQVVAADPKRFSERSILKCVKNVYKKEGPSAFFAGAAYRGGWLGTRQSIAFTFFEKGRKIVNEYLYSQTSTPSK